MTSKLAYEIYLDRIKEEERVGFSLGDSTSDWRRAEDMIKFFEAPKQNTLKWANQFEDYAKYWAVYERLKGSNSVA